jgi:radical SAM protein with 4Fe4S-binding SPASM domain
LLDGAEIKHILDFVKKKNRNKRKLRLTYACPGFLGLDYEKDTRGFYFNCRTGINIASILYNGDLFVCPNVPRRSDLIQGNIRTHNFADVWKNGYRQFRHKDRTQCDYCDKCDYLEYCLGGAFHTWDFEKNLQPRCPYDMMLKAGEQKNV